jgi:hypothetical protein
MSDDEREFAMCDYCEDECGLCDKPHLADGRRFSIMLDKTFDVQTASHNDKYFFVIKHDFCFFCFSL